MTDVATPRALPIAVVVLAFNEARNLPACLASVAGWTPEVFVVDSGSTDGTADLARQSGAIVVDHAFDSHARQWQWALATLPIRASWVLGLDADQRVSPELWSSIAAVVTNAGDTGPNGYFMARRQIFRGRWIRHGGYYPKYLLKLFRRSAVTIDDTDLVDHHFHVSGRTAILRGDLIEDNQNEAAIAVWTEKHNRYAVRQAQQEAGRVPPVPLRALWQSPDGRTRWLKRQWARLPLFARPCLYVFYRYVVRFGFLDGREGFIFHVLQGFWYRLLVDVNIDELKTTAAPSEALNGRSRPTPSPAGQAMAAEGAATVPSRATEGANIR